MSITAYQLFLYALGMAGLWTVPGPVWLALTALVPATRTGLAVVLLFGLEISGWLLRCFSLNQVFIYPCSTRAGLYYCSDSREAAELNVLHQFIQQNCPPQSQVLAYPYLARLYTTEQLRNPIPFPLLTPVLFDEADFQVAASRLD